MFKINEKEFKLPKFDFQRVFSVRNVDTRKVITILGIKFKIKSKRLIERCRWENINNQLFECKNLITCQNNIISQQQNFILTENQKQIQNIEFAIQKIINDKENNLKNIIIEKENNIKNIIVENKHDALEKQYLINSRFFTAKSIQSNAFSDFRGCFRDRDVVLVAAGPSVKYFEPIQDAVYVGCNRAFLYDKVNFDFLFAIDKVGIKDYYKEFFDYKPDSCIKFVGYQNLGKNYQIPENIIPLTSNIRRYVTNAGMNGYSNWDFPYDISSVPLLNPPTVSLQAMQFILYTQPRRIYIVGVDCTCSSLQHFAGNSDDCSFRNEDLKNNDYWSIEYFKKLKEFACEYYPDTEIISINPVGLKGIFKDIYTHVNVESLKNYEGA